MKKKPDEEQSYEPIQWTRLYVDDETFQATQDVTMIIMAVVFLWRMFA